MNPAQCRMARAALDWTIKHFAKTAGVSEMTILRFEAGSSKPINATMGRMRTAFESAGIVFHDTGCVCPPQS